MCGKVILLCIHTYLFFLKFFSHIGYYRILSRVPCAYSRSLLMICFTCSVYACTRAKSLQSCLTLCNHMDCNPPDSSVHGILLARIPEWLPCPPPGDLPNPGVEPVSCIGRFFAPSATWEAQEYVYVNPNLSPPIFPFW